MPVSAGTRLGPYEITAQIGKGGMGEVYQATDTNLKRQVAIKVLPESVAADSERLARFQREAEVLASLNHPNIAAIYGLEKSDRTTALVMELVEGPTLEDRIKRGPIPVDEALPIAKQIAEALEAAHEQGIIHRDLKPANVKVRPDGAVKVLDFGLAKAMEPTSAMSPGLSQAPTITTPAMTQAGVILGTATYMSPEQARGKPVDKRTDIWAFGCVLFEMLTGRRAYEGEDVSVTLANIINAEPAWDALPTGMSPSLVTYLTRCLQKDPKDRVRDIGDVRLALEGAFETGGSPSVEPAISPRPTWRRAVVPVAMLWASGIAVMTFIVAMAIVLLLQPTEAPLPEMRVTISTPTTLDPISHAISPDGRHLVFAAIEEGESRLWLRSLDSATAVPLDGTEGASYPFWSPDSRSVAFFAGGSLSRIDVEGGVMQRVAEVANGRGGSWSGENVILFASIQTGGGLMQVDAAGGTPTPVTSPSAGVASHRFPQFLPDGQQFIFFVTGAADVEGVYLGSLDGTEPRRLAASDAAAVFMDPDWLFLLRQQTLLAQRFDAASGELSGDAVAVANGVSGTRRCL